MGVVVRVAGQSVGLFLNVRPVRGVKVDHASAGRKISEKSAGYKKGSMKLLILIILILGGCVPKSRVVDLEKRVELCGIEKAALEEGILKYKRENALLRDSLTFYKQLFSGAIKEQKAARVDK
jgi:hypothetical protein